MDDTTFGAFLRSVMEARKLSASKLAELTGNKSKTAVVRLMNDKSGQATIIKFSQILLNKLELTDDETEQMEQILNKNDVSPAKKKAMKDLLLLFKNDYFNKTHVGFCVAHNSEPVNKAMTADEIFDVCYERESLVIIEAVASAELAFALDRVIHKTTNRKLSPVVNCFFKPDEGVEAKAKELLMLMKLSNMDQCQ